MRKLAVLILTLCAACVSSVGQGTLGTATFSVPVGISRLTNGGALAFGQNLIGGGSKLAIFETLHFTADDVGRLFPITSADDPDFDPLVAILTNGTSDTIGWAYIEGYGGGFSNFRENGFFSLPPGGNGIDFRGFHIDNIALRLDQATLTSLKATILVNSQPVPEPGVAALFAYAVCLIALSRFGARSRL